MSDEERKQILYFQYTNWEGKTAWRRAVPLPIPPLFGPDNWHPEPEWKMAMFDLDKMDRRAFTLKDMKIGTEADYKAWHEMEAIKKLDPSH
jgi:hypothetical protein